jgi:regulator of protease activity HflC (stomatin/prohibitin superfamily)
MLATRRESLSVRAASRVARAITVVLTEAGFHLTWPFTSVATMTIRTQNYSMTANPTKSPGTTTDDAVRVLGADGGAATVNATVLFRLDTRRATEVYRTLGTGYVTTVVRPFARTCIRSEFSW